MRLLFFSFEHRQQITDLFFKSYSRLEIAVGIFIKFVVSLAKLREKTDAGMTDAVTKKPKH